MPEGVRSRNGGGAGPLRAGYDPFPLELQRPPQRFVGVPETPVDDQRLRLTVGELVPKDLPFQASVQRDEHRRALGEPEPEQRKLGGVEEEGRHAVPGADAGRRKSVRHPVGFSV